MGYDFIINIFPGLSFQIMIYDFDSIITREKDHVCRREWFFF